MAARPRPLVDEDPADAIARVMEARRPVLLRVYAHRLPRADLEDCLQQAALELIPRARARARAFADDAHVANALAQRFLSRVADRHRALGGRSPAQATLAAALGTGQGTEEETPLTERVADPRPSVEQQVEDRLTLAQLREVAQDLTDDQQFVLACQNIGLSSAEVCARKGWSAANFRKIAQRGRARVVAMVADHDAGERCLALRSDFVALFSHTASESQSTRAQLHLANCPGCTLMAHDAAIAARRVAALLPPVAALRDDDAPNRLAAVFAHLRRLLPGGADHADTAVAAKAGAAGAVGASAAGGSTLAGGGVAGVGALKLGVAALCAAGTVGTTVAVCERAGVLQGDLSAPVHHRQHHAKRAAASVRHANASAAARTPTPITAVVTTSGAPTQASTARRPSPTRSSSSSSSSKSASSASNEFGFEGAGGSAPSSSGSSSTSTAQAASTSPSTSTPTRTSTSSAPTAPSKAASSEFGFEGG